MQISLNYLAIFVSSVFSLFLGFLWFAKIFVRPYQKYMDIKEYGTPPTVAVMVKSMGTFVLGAMLTATVLALGLEILRLTFPQLSGHEPSLYHALSFSFFIWLGFVVPFYMGKVSWEFKSWWLVLILSSFEAVRFFVMTLILWFWRLG